MYYNYILTVQILIAKFTQHKIQLTINQPPTILILKSLPI